MFEVTYTASAFGTGKTREMTYEECVEEFGAEEFEEILAGNLPHIIAVEIHEEPEYDGQPDELTEWMDFDPDC